MEDVGPVSVFVEGDVEKMKVSFPPQKLIQLFQINLDQVSSNIFLTLHTVGTSYKHWVKFNQEEDMKEVSILFPPTSVQ